MVLNPLMPAIEVDRGVWLAVFITLWSVEPDGSLVPDLAAEVPTLENGGTSEGGLAWRIKLKEGALWHDGTPFTAEDVKYTQELINASGFRSRTRQDRSLVRDITVHGPHEMSSRMECAFAPYTMLLTDTFIVPNVPPAVGETAS
jgi:peptide/nickel transport system substrate-binding protein